MSLTGGVTMTGGVRFPRVSGDEPGSSQASESSSPFSPRERG